MESEPPVPREHVYGESLAVTSGELAVLAARRPDDLTQLVPPAHDGGRPLVPLTVGELLDHGAQRRRLDVLEAFAAAVCGLVDGAPVGGDPGRSAERRAAAWAELRDLRRELAARPSPPLARSADRREHDAIAAQVDREAAASPPVVDGEVLSVQRRATLAWSRDAGLVTLRVDGYSHARATDVDLGGVLLPLDWSGCNRLARKLVVARNQAWGEPA